MKKLLIMFVLSLMTVLFAGCADENSKDADLNVIERLDHRVADDNVTIKKSIQSGILEIQNKKSEVVYLMNPFIILPNSKDLNGIISGDEITLSGGDGNTVVNSFIETSIAADTVGQIIYKYSQRYIPVSKYASGYTALLTKKQVDYIQTILDKYGRYGSVSFSYLPEDVIYELLNYIEPDVYKVNYTFDDSLIGNIK